MVFSHPGHCGQTQLKGGGILNRAARRQKQRAQSVDVYAMLADMLFIFAHKGVEAFRKESPKVAHVLIEPDALVRFGEACKMIENGIGLLPDPIASTEKTSTGQLLRFRVNGAFMDFRLIVLNVYIRSGKRAIVELFNQLTNRKDGEVQESASLIGQILEVSLVAISEGQGSPAFAEFMRKIEQARLAVANA